VGIEVEVVEYLRQGGLFHEWVFEAKPNDQHEWANHDPGLGVGLSNDQS